MNAAEETIVNVYSLRQPRFQMSEPAQNRQRMRGQETLTLRLSLTPYYRRSDAGVGCYVVMPCGV